MSGPQILILDDDAGAAAALAQALERRGFGCVVCARACSPASRPGCNFCIPTVAAWNVFQYLPRFLVKTAPYEFHYQR